MFSFLSGERKENQKRKPGTRLGWPAAPVRQRRLPYPQKYLRGFFSSVLFLSVKEKEPKRKLRNPLRLTRCARPSAALVFTRKKYFAGLF